MLCKGNINSNKLCSTFFITFCPTSTFPVCVSLCYFVGHRDARGSREGKAWISAHTRETLNPAEGELSSTPYLQNKMGSDTVKYNIERYTI